MVILMNPEEPDAKEYEPTKADWAAIAECFREPSDDEIYAILDHLYQERVAAGLEPVKLSAF